MGRAVGVGLGPFAADGGAESVGVGVLVWVGLKREEGMKEGSKERC